MTTLAATCRTYAELAERARTATPPDTFVVAWGVRGASTDGFTIAACDERWHSAIAEDRKATGAELICHAVRFAQGRVGGKAGHVVVWGLPDDVVRVLDEQRVTR